MKAKCVDNSGDGIPLTIGRMYEVKDDPDFLDLYIVDRDDNGSKETYFKSRFEAITKHLYIFRLYKGEDISPETYVCYSPSLEDAMQTFTNGNNATTSIPALRYTSLDGCQTFLFTYTETFNKKSHTSTWFVTEILDLKTNYLYS